MAAVSEEGPAEADDALSLPDLGPSDSRGRLPECAADIS